MIVHETIGPLSAVGTIQQGRPDIVSFCHFVF